MKPQQTHHGHNIKRLREIQGIKQEALALELGDGWNQKKISHLESKEKISEEMRNRVAKALHVPPQAIESFDENTLFNNIASTFHLQAAWINCEINPIDKLMEVLEENKLLYKSLLQAEKEKNELLSKMLTEQSKKE